MNSKQRKTLRAVFTDEIESLLKAAGCETVEGSGSAVKLRHGTLIASFHRPHPQKEAKRYQVLDAREFLRRLGVTP